MTFLLKWLVGSVSFLLVDYLVAGINISDFLTALLVTLIWGFVSVFIKPILHILFLPINLITLGIFTLIINGFLFYAVASLVPGFEVAGFWTAVLGAVLVSIVSFVLGKLLIKN